MAKDFFIADTHFGGESIRRYENRPFASAEEMDEKLIENWNSVVSAEDTVYVLGDFSEYGADDYAETDLSEAEGADSKKVHKDQAILSRLNGTKILVMGNHDNHRTPEEWRQLGFDECSKWPILYNQYFILSHEPLYINANMPYANFFGHVHANPIYKDACKQSVCISAERINYTPVEFAELKAKLQ